MQSTAHNPFYWQTDAVNSKKIQLLDQWVVGKRVVDVGTASGVYAQHLRRAGLTVIALDMTPDYILDKSGIHFLVAQAPPLPLADAVCDTLVLFDVLEHIEQEDTMLAEIYRTTRQRLILSVPADNDGMLPKYGLCLLHHLDKTHYREYSPASLQAVLSKHGWRVLHLEPQYNYGMLYTSLEFFTPSAAGKIARLLTHIWFKLMRQLGVMRQQLPSDWLVVAEKISD